MRTMAGAVSLAAGVLFALGPPAGIARAQAPTAVRGVEPVILTGKQIPAWTRSAAAVVCTPQGA